MYHHALLAFVLAASTSIALAADDLADQVQVHVRQLDAKELVKRDAAERALRELGPGILPLLPEQPERLPPETRQRLVRIRQALEQAAAEAAVQPSRITLAGEALPLDKVLAALAEQSGNAIVDHRAELGQEVTNPPIKCAFDRALFWHALDDVLDQAELSLYPYAGRGIFVAARPEGELPRRDKGTVSGPFRLVPTRLEVIRNLTNERGNSFKLFVECMWEPRLKPVVILQPLAELTATGDDGAPLAIDDSEGEPEAVVDAESNQVELQMPLALPPRRVQRIASLKGKLVMLVPGPVTTFRFERLPIAGEGPPPAPAQQRQAGVTVAVEQLRKNQAVWELRLQVRFDSPGQALESHRQWVLANEAYLVGADGKAIEYGGYEQMRRTEDEIGLMYLFNEQALGDAPEKLSFVYKTPAAIIELPVEFDLREIELP